MKTTLRPDDARRAVAADCDGASDSDDLLDRVATRIHELVPHDGATWFGLDPSTHLATAPVRIEGFGEGECEPFWDRELNHQDLASFHTMARTPAEPVPMRLALDDCPARSIRYRELMAPNGYDDEIRGALRVGAAAWGVYALYREKGRPPFDRDDCAVLEAVGPAIATALRAHVRRANPWNGSLREPGLVVFDRELNILSANQEALGWLRTLSRADEPEDAPPRSMLEYRRRFEVATPLAALAARARAVASGYERTPARLRLRDRNDRWLVLHASCLAGDDRPADRGEVAVVIEPAKSAEVAPIIIDAYSLTPRERDVVSALARGGSTAEIACELFLSPHTVRDYVKTVFEKVGVSSRAELVARLFAEHYYDRVHAAALHAD